MTDRQIAHLMTRVKKDSIYQDFLQLRSIYEPEFHRILQLLSPEDQHYLTMYVKICEGLESRTARTACFLTPEYRT